VSAGVEGVVAGIESACLHQRLGVKATVKVSSVSPGVSVGCLEDLGVFPCR
jgi:hypothetical protein